MSVVSDTKSDGGKAAWMEEAANELEPSPLQNVHDFCSSRWKVAMVVGVLAIAIVYVTAPPMIQDSKGNREIAKASFWGFIAASVVVGMPLLVEYVQKPAEDE